MFVCVNPIVLNNVKARLWDEGIWHLSWSYELKTPMMFCFIRMPIF